MTLGIMTRGIMTLGTIVAMTQGIMKFSLKSPSTPSIKGLIATYHFSLKATI